MRDIASAAGMSTGAVFASFAGKWDVFGEIIQADRSATYEVMGAILEEKLERGDEPIDETLAAMFEAGYQFRLADLPLMQAAISASWSPELGREVRERMDRRPVVELVVRALEAATSRGELTRDVDTDLLGRMLWDSYLANYTEAAYEGWSLVRLMKRMRAQISILLTSARRDRP